MSRPLLPATDGIAEDNARLFNLVRGALSELMACGRRGGMFATGNGGSLETSGGICKGLMIPDASGVAVGVEFDTAGTLGADRGVFLIVELKPEPGLLKRLSSDALWSGAGEDTVDDFMVGVDEALATGVWPNAAEGGSVGREDDAAATLGLRVRSGDLPNSDRSASFWLVPAADCAGGVGESTLGNADGTG